MADRHRAGQAGVGQRHPLRPPCRNYRKDYGGKPQFLYDLDSLGLLYVGEVPPHFRCWPSFPKYRSGQAPFVSKRVDNAVLWGKPFVGQKWRTFKLDRQSVVPQTWEVRAAQVWLQKDGRTDYRPCRPTDRRYWLIVARNVSTGEVKYFVSNAPPKTRLLKVAFSRWGIEHVFRVAKSEIGFDHFEGRTYPGLMRHVVLCQVVMLFIAEQTTRLRGKKSGPVGTDDGADGPGAQHRLPRMDAAPPQRVEDRACRVGHSIPPETEPGRQALPDPYAAAQPVAL